MELPRDELERMIFFEDARKRAEMDHEENPEDAQVLTRWGGAMLELAHFKQGDDAVEMIELAISKFQAALKIEPRKHDALWCLGNALTSQGFLFQEAEKACSYFDEAKNCFQRALNEEPANEIYRKALEMTDKAPGLHAELQRQLSEQQQSHHDASKTASAKNVLHSEKSVGGDFWYEFGGWLCFMGVALSWTLMLTRQRAF